MTPEERDEAIREAMTLFAATMRQAAITLNELCKTVEDARRKINDLGEERP